MATENPRTPEYWRGRAAEARAMLDRARDPNVRAYLAEIAQEYERMAEMAEGEASPTKGTPTDLPKG